jgi:DNA-binding NarL/FixJ family response regulator
LTVLLRSEPGLVPVGSTTGAEEAARMVARLRPDVVVLDPRTVAGGLRICRRLKDTGDVERVLLYTTETAEAGLSLQARIAGADGLADKGESPGSLFEALRRVGRGQEALPAIAPGDLEAAALRVEPDDLALLAMLADRTPPAEAASTLRLDERRVRRRIDRVLGRLRGPAPSGVGLPAPF